MKDLLEKKKRPDISRFLGKVPFTKNVFVKKVLKSPFMQKLRVGGGSQMKKPYTFLSNCCDPWDYNHIIKLSEGLEIFIRHL